jgi:hypothetical protein
MLSNLNIDAINKISLRIIEHLFDHILAATIRIDESDKLVMKNNL